MMWRWIAANRPRKISLQPTEQAAGAKPASCIV
jgi:hypothetical protein